MATKPEPTARAVSSATYLAMKKLERRLGGREVIAKALLLSDDILMKKAGELIADPANADRTIQYLLGQVDPTMTFGKFVRAYAKGRADEAYAATIDQIAERLPDTAEHLMRTSVPHDVDCPDCNGRKEVPEGGSVECDDKGPACARCRGTGSYKALVPCLRCAGTGLVKRDPETERIKLALQAGGILGTGGVTVTQVNQKIEATVVQNSSSFRLATDKLLWAAAPQAQLEEGAQGGEVFDTSVIEEAVPVDAVPVEQEEAPEP